MSLSGEAVGEELSLFCFPTHTTTHTFCMQSSSYGSDEGLRNGDVAEVCEVRTPSSSRLLSSSSALSSGFHTLFMRGAPSTLLVSLTISTDDVQSTTLGPAERGRSGHSFRSQDCVSHNQLKDTS